MSPSLTQYELGIQPPWKCLRLLAASFSSLHFKAQVLVNLAIRKAMDIIFDVVGIDPDSFLCCRCEQSFTTITLFLACH